MGTVLINTLPATTIGTLLVFPAGASGPQYGAPEFLLYGDTTPLLESPDGSPETFLHLGTAFRTSVNGRVTGVRIYQSTLNSGSHTVSLYQVSGSLLASKSQVVAPGLGWRSVDFDAPALVSSGTVYKAVVSIAKDGGTLNFWRNGVGYFLNERTEGNLTAVSSSESINGTYDYSFTSPPQDPTLTINQSLYWISPIFQAEI